MGAAAAQMNTAMSRHVRIEMAAAFRRLADAG